MFDQILSAVSTVLIPSRKAAVTPISHHDAGWKTIFEPFAGAWQRNISRKPADILKHTAVYACVTLIKGDIGKLGLDLVRKDRDGIWVPEENNPAYTVLKKPNRYQTRIKFVENWVTSKLLHGNAYALKERDNSRKVRALYLLDPCRVRPVVAPDGSVFYQLSSDNLAGVTQSQTVPASEIIHDVMDALYHPLCGVSPITAACLPAVHGLNIQENSTRYFINGSKPGGLLLAPGNIDQAEADRLTAAWQARQGGENLGKVALLTAGLKYESMSIDPVDAQLIEQLKFTGEQVATCFHIPAWMIGVGTPPSLGNLQSLIQMYYAQALQTLIEAFELCMTEGLDLDSDLQVQLNLSDLFLTDMATRVKTAVEAIGGAVQKPNEARKSFNLPPVEGGDALYLQQQNYSLAALAKRDAREDPFSTAPKPAPIAESAPEPDEEDDESEKVIDFSNVRQKFAPRRKAA